MRGKFITFEGIDGSGKSTQLRMISSDLRMAGFDVINTMQPGGTPLGRRLREAFLETEETVDPMAELLLFAADRAQHVNFLIKPAIEAGKIVISDRYADATRAYQGAGRGFDKETIETVIQLATGGLQPDLTLFFDIPVLEAVRRLESRDDKETKTNRMDTESVEFYTRVRESYLQIAKNNADRFVTIDSTGSIEETHAKASEIVKNFIE